MKTGFHTLSFAKNGGLVGATWDEAMSLVVGKSKSVIERLTQHGIAFYTTGQFFLEGYYALARNGDRRVSTSPCRHPKG